MTQTTGGKRHADHVMNALEHVEVDPEARQKIAAQRAQNRLRRLDHHAHFTRDLEATRHLYEDVLGLPMSIAMSIPETPSGDPIPYFHVFFELGDGSAIAFFDAPGYEKREPAQLTGFDHHIAIHVDSMEDLEYYRARLHEANYAPRFVDHGVFMSMYIRDPNGMNLEITCNPEGTEGYFVASRQVAHDEYRKWMEAHRTP